MVMETDGLASEKLISKEEDKKTRVVITYPDVTLPAINLWVVIPAWYFYATPEERAKYYEELLNSE